MLSKRRLAFGNLMSNLTVALTHEVSLIHCLLHS